MNETLGRETSLAPPSIKRAADNVLLKSFIELSPYDFSKMLSIWNSKHSTILTIHFYF
jgi:hypothetical protein